MASLLCVQLRSTSLRHEETPRCLSAASPARSQLVPPLRGVLGRQSTLSFSRQHSDRCTSPPIHHRRCALTVAVGVGVVPSAALLAPRPGILRSAETPPGGVAASRQRPDSAAAAHCKREKTSALLWEYRETLVAFSEAFKWTRGSCPKCSNC